MKLAYIPDVGHGLAAKLITISGETVQIDCGNRHDGELAYEKGLQRPWPDILFLSHFHQDHYSGLVNAPDSRLDINEVIIPKIPEHPDRRRFVERLFATDFLVYGRRTGSLGGDLCQNIRRINRNEFSIRSVSRGETVSVGSSKFEVLWPPETLWNGVSDLLREGIEAFDEAIDVDGQLREISALIEEKEVVEPYLTDEEGILQPEVNPLFSDEFNYLFEDRELPEIVQEAHNKLRKAADRMSLAMHLDNRFLFMGDLMGGDIRRVVNHLLGKQRNHFFVIITPHHGTRWHNNMADLDCVWAVSSAGENNLRSIKSDFRSICEHNWVTHLNGDLTIPAYMIWNPHISRLSKWPHA